MEAQDLDDRLATDGGRNRGYCDLRSQKMMQVLKNECSPFSRQEDDGECDDGDT